MTVSGCFVRGLYLMRTACCPVIFFSVTDCFKLLCAWSVSEGWWLLSDDMFQSLTVSGCFVHGLCLEGAGWDMTDSCLIKQKPKQLIQELPVLKIIPIEAHRLKLQVCTANWLCFKEKYVTLCFSGLLNLIVILQSVDTFKNYRSYNDRRIKHTFVL